MAPGARLTRLPTEVRSARTLYPTNEPSRRVQTARGCRGRRENRRRLSPRRIIAARTYYAILLRFFTSRGDGRSRRSLRENCRDDSARRVNVRKNKNKKKNALRENGTPCDKSCVEFFASSRGGGEGGDRERRRGAPRTAPRAFPLSANCSLSLLA